MRPAQLLPLALVALLPVTGAAGDSVEPEAPAVFHFDPDVLAGKGNGPKRPAQVLRIHVLSVGQGDATIIEGPANSEGDRKVMMVDSGESAKQGNEAKHEVEPYLRQHLDDGPATRPVATVDYYVPTHYHKDHIGWTAGRRALASSICGKPSA